MSNVPVLPSAPVITIDGPGGSGKGTVATELARALGWRVLDSGALYRLTGLLARRAGLNLTDEQAITRIAAGLQVDFRRQPDGSQAVLVAGEDLTEAIRTEDCAADASRVASMQAVRAALVAQQRACRRPPGLVADGRDMGTMIFPDAELKIYLTAGVRERAERRHKQLKAQGIDVSLAALCSDISARDQRDAARDVAPLQAAPDAERIDSTALTVAEVTDIVLARARELGLVPAAT